MNTTKQIAKHFREVHFGGNWTSSNLKEQLSDVTWIQATTKIHSFNTIATLAFHINYYVAAILRILQSEDLNASDKLSFDHPPINNQADWDNMLNKFWQDAELFATLLEQLPDEKLWKIFADIKYGIYFRNLLGLNEHTHYHLGQIVLLKKLVLMQEKS
ncbi:MAG: DUF1572 domain-containing protein [Bacteroidetes bacterium]|nr:DUF1572 domain-containing protein [Bacteroidota bacterium]